MNKASERQKRYDEKAMKRYGLKLHKENDADVIGRLEDADNMQGYIKALVRADLGIDLFWHHVARELVDGMDMVEYHVNEDGTKFARMRNGNSMFCCEITEQPDGTVKLSQVVRAWKYGMRLRGYAPMCQPKEGLIGALDGDGRYHNVLLYDRILSDDEVKDYELDFLGAM